MRARRCRIADVRLEGGQCSSSGDRRSPVGRLVGSGAAVGVLALLGAAPLAAPPARADFDGLFDPIVDAVSQAASSVDSALPGDLAAGIDIAGIDIDGALAPAVSALDSVSMPSLADPLGSLDALLSNWFQVLVYDPIQELGQLWSASPFGQLLDPLTGGPHGAAATWLFGSAGTDTAPAAAAVDTAPAGADDALQTATVPLRMQAVTEPVVDISVNGGPATPVLVDTGSAGLVLPIWDLGLQHLTFPTGWGMGAYSGGLTYIYLTMPATVDFGNGLVTEPTSINAVICAFPSSWSSFVTTGGTWESFFAPAGVDGVLGIGPNAVGPTPGAIVTSALPGALGDGVLIDQANGVLQFGPNPLGDDAVAVNGAPNALLAVSINDGPLQHNVPSIIDSGGVYGTMPASLLGQTGGVLPPGSNVAVYSNDGANLLYSYTTNVYQSPVVISSGSMNTGNYPFDQQPVYISNAGPGMTIFGGPPAA